MLLSASAACHATASAPLFDWARPLLDSVITDKRHATLDVAADGDIAVVTRATWVPDNDSDIRVARYSPSGSLRWVRDIDGLGHGFDSPAALRFLADGSLVVAGYGRMADGSSTGGVVARLAIDGSVIWQREFGSTSGYATVDALGVDGQGGLVVAGVAHGGGDGLVTTRLDINGNLLWQRTYAPESRGLIKVSGLVVEANGATTVVAPTEASVAASSAWIASYDITGGPRWSRVIENPGGRDALLSGIAAGRTLMATSIDEDNVTKVRIEAFGPDGATAYEATLTPPDGMSDRLWAAGALEDGGFALVGSSYASPFATEYAVLVMRFAHDGTLRWRRTQFGGVAGRAYGWDVSPGRGNSLLVAATSADESTDQDSMLLELSADGRLNWRRIWDGGGRESATDVRLGADGAVIAAGVRDGNSSVRGSFVLSYRDDGIAADGFE
jgi:hypothetical protein